MSRRTPRNYDHTPARRRPPDECVVVCTDGGRHGDRVVARLAWVQDDINPSDPRWRPARFVLRGKRGDIISTGEHDAVVRLRCETCDRVVQPTWAWLSDRAHGLINEAVHRIELSHLNPPH